MKRRRAADPEIARVGRERCREWYRGHREYNKARARNIKLKLAYGISLADFDRMLCEQGGRCACCGTDKPDGKGNMFHVDHDHATGKVRGLLCCRCNAMLGNARDDIARLAAGIEYLNSRRRLAA